MGRFNNEMLEVQDLHIDMMIGILIAKEGSFAPALARDPPISIEELMNIVEKFIHEEEINAMKDVECARPRRGRDRRDREGHQRGRCEKDH